MKKINILIGAIMLVLNLAIGLLFPGYEWFNCGLTRVVIVLTTTLMELIMQLSLKDAFKIGLASLTSVVGLIEFIVGCFSPSGFSGNWGIATILILLALHAIMLLIVHLVSNNN